jgi:preprotein translocase subunit SecA
METVGFIMNFLRAIFPSKNTRDVKKIWPVVHQINEIEAELQKLSNEQLRAKTTAWKDELSKIEDEGELANRLHLQS